MNNIEREQWERFLSKLDYYQSWSFSDNMCKVQKIPMKGNEFTYERLLKMPCFVMDIGRDRNGKYFEGWFSNWICIARIIWKQKIKNYPDNENGKEDFLEDFCKLVSEGKESDVDYIILDHKILPEFIERVNKTVQARN